MAGEGSWLSRAATVVANTAGLKVALSALLARAAGSISLADLPPPTCGPRFSSPGVPSLATDHNGAVLPDVCFVHEGEYHVFVLGDWGGVVPLEGSPAMLLQEPRPADMASRGARGFVEGVDDKAQLRVAAQMKARARVSNPDFILNLGDCFYWGGIEAQCGASAGQHLPTGQWRRVFEEVYDGPELEGKQWLGVLGNHDYGGYKFTNGWDQVIGYTWAGHLEYSQDRWVMPAQYWKNRVWYPDFSVDYYLIDSNVFSAWFPDIFVEDNICSRKYNFVSGSCGPEGPHDLEDCPRWFANLWRDQAKWLEGHLDVSTSDWQVVVTHIPPDAGKEGWKHLAETYGVDLVVSGHRHHQEIWAPNASDNFLAPTAIIVSGGGGGITSTGMPSADGEDDEYGFVDLTFTRASIKVEAISHGGQLRRTVHVPPRPRAATTPGAAGAAAGAPSPFELVGAGGLEPAKLVLL